MRRQRLEIMAQILAFCMQGRRKTHIMYTAKLSHTQLKTYLKKLTSQGLIARPSERYETTEKGHRFLGAFLSLKRFFKEDARVSSFDVIFETYKEAQISSTEVNSQVETGLQTTPSKKAAIIILVKLTHEAEKKSRQELETEIRKALEESLARIASVALEDVIIVEEESLGTRIHTHTGGEE